MRQGDNAVCHVLLEIAYQQAKHGPHTDIKTRLLVLLIFDTDALQTVYTAANITPSLPTPLSYA